MTHTTNTKNLGGTEKGMPELASSAMQYHLAKVEESHGRYTGHYGDK